MIRLLACAALLLTSAASAQQDPRCPTLPEGTDLVWSYSEGPDFEVCYAMTADSSATAFGFYFGRWPSFDPDEGVPVGDGTLAGQAVVWYQRLTGEDDEVRPGELAQQTVLVLNPDNHFVAHVWVMGATPEELQARLGVLEAVSLE